MSVTENTGPVAGAGDVGELYGLLAKRLEQIVRMDVRAPEAVVEDACQFAWSRLVDHRHRVHRETVMSWLARTAIHEAFKLARCGRRELPLEIGSEDDVAGALAPSFLTPDVVVEARERLAEVSLLPERQQRVLWLLALGLSYREIAGREGCTVRTVERQLLRARQQLRQDRAA